MPEFQYICALAAIFLFMGIFASKVSDFLKIPTLLMFLFVGMLAGEEGLGGVIFSDYDAANRLGSLALAFILFAGGFDTRWADVKKVIGCGTLLASVGVLLTAVFIGVFVYFLMGGLAVEPPYTFMWAILLGCVVSSTDAAATFAIFRSKGVGLKGDLRPILEYESGSNDPMAAFLTLFMIGMINQPEAYAYWMVIPYFLMKMSIGVIVGLAVGFAIVRLMDRVKLEYDGLYYVIGIGTVFAAFSISEYTGGNGFMSAYVCGMVFGNTKYIYRYGLARFHDGIAWLMQVAMFLALGLLVSLSELQDAAIYGFVIAMFIMFVARPLAVYLCMLGSRFNYKERTLVAWGGIRGAAPVILATFPCIHHIPHAITLFHIVFFIVLSSMFVQGKTLMPVARMLGLDEPLKEKASPPLQFEETGNASAEMHEYEITEHSAHCGKPLAMLAFPQGVLVFLIRRQNQFLVPRGNTMLEAEDELLMMVEAGKEPEVEAILSDN